MATETHPGTHSGTPPDAPADAPVLPVEDVIRMVERMTPPDRLRVLEVASRLVHKDIVKRVSPFEGAAPTEGADREVLAERARILSDNGTVKVEVIDDDDEAAWQTERARILANVPPESSAHRLLGAFRGKGPIAMTPDEERAIVEDALMEKYGQ